MAAIFFENFVRFVLIALWVLVFARVILSWVDPGGRGAIARFAIQTTEPLLAPVRRLLPSGGGFDLSPIIVTLVLSAIIQAIS